MIAHRSAFVNPNVTDLAKGVGSLQSAMPSAGANRVFYERNSL
jgi:hypothetical protein